MDDKKHFQSEVKTDLPLIHEFLKLSIDTYGRNTFFRLLQFCIVLYFIKFIVNKQFRLFFFAFALLFIAKEWWNHRKCKNGGTLYQQILYQHDGNIPHHLITFEEEHMRSRNLLTGNEQTTQYSRYVRIWQSKNLLILFLDVNMYQIVDKRTLTGGTPQELIAYLRSKCPRLKKQVLTGKLGRFARWLVWVSLALGMIAAAPHLLHIPEKLSGRITNEMSFAQMAEELNSLGITIDPETLVELEEYESQISSDPYYGEYLKVMDLLCWEGMGKYDEHTWVWTPSESGVYWFDLEVMNISTMYTDFLRGVDAMDEALSFSNIQEDYTHVDIESGMGFVILSFDYLGQQYSFNARFEDDWFDTEMLHHIGLILNSDSDPRDLWYAVDGQGVLLYYGTENQAEALKKKTGISFLDSADQLLYN